MRQMTTMFALMLGLLLAASNVMADRAPPREDPKPDPKPAEETALPWTQEEIRNKWDDGITFEFTLTNDGKPDGGMRLEAETITEKSFVGTTVSISNEREERVEKAKEKTWEVYLGELTQRIKGAAITDEEITVPAGKYKCKRYAVPAAAASVTYWFAADLPGIFIKAENRMMKDGKEISQTWELAAVGVPLVQFPWSYKQVQESWKDGATLKYDDENGEQKGTVAFKVESTDNDGLTASMTFGDKAMPAKHQKWAKFYREFTCPRAIATISEETIETPAGKFECQVIKWERKKTVNTVYIAKSEPGLLVKAVRKDFNGKEERTNTVTLTEFKKGK
jgi:hypothetical protein